MTPLHFDNQALTIIAGQFAKHPDAALRLEMKISFGRGGPMAYLVAGWTTIERAERMPHLLRVSGVRTVPLFMPPRLLRYLTWHPITVRGRRFGPFRRLSAAVDPLFLETLRYWERQHPAIALPSRAA